MSIETDDKFKKVEFEKEEELYEEGKSLKLICPNCGSAYNHSTEPFVLNGNDNYEAINNGYRGDATVLPMECEDCETKWNLVIQFHKGFQFMYVYLGNLPKNQKINLRRIG
jgi:hypothetical protein